MKTTMQKTERAFVALISAVVLSVMLLGLSTTANSAGFSARFNALNSEYKRIALGLAESCVNQVLLHVAKDHTYEPTVGGETVSVGTGECTILDVEYDTADEDAPQRIASITTQGKYRDAFSNITTSIVVANPNNSALPANLFVVVSVINNNGGLATASDLTVSITPGANPNPATFVGAGTGTLATLIADAGYSVSVTNLANYSETLDSNCSSVTGIAEGETRTCVITVDDTPTTGRLTINLSVINDDGGIKTPSDFEVQIDSVTRTPGQPYTFSPGTRTLLGVAEAGYDITAQSGYCGAISLSAGDDKTCTITFDDIEPPSPACADTVMMLDRTGSMSSGDLANERTAANGLLDLYDNLTPPPKTAIGVFGGVGYSEPYNAQIVQGLTSVYATLYTAITTGLATGNGYTNLASAISTAQNEFNANGTPGREKVLILLSDGGTNRPTSDPYGLAYTAANNAKNAGTKIFTVHFGDAGPGSSFTDQDYLAKLASGSVPNSPHQPGSVNDHAGAQTLMTDGFGTGNDADDITSWDEEGDDGDSSTRAKAPGSGDDSASPNGGRFAMIGRDEWICRTVNATGASALTLSFYWRGDSSAEGNDDLIVEYNQGSSCTSNSGWDELDTYNLNQNSWSSLATLSLPSSLNNDSSFAVRFRVDSNSGGEDGRVDGVTVAGSAVNAAAENSDGDYFFIAPTSADMPAIFSTIGALVCPAAANPVVTFVPTTGTIMVSKHVINDNTGTSQASDFTINVVSAVNPSISSFSGAEAPGIAVTVGPGAYDIDEGSYAGYAKTRSGCSGTISAGETKLCTITNDDLPGAPPPPPPPPPNITIGAWQES